MTIKSNLITQTYLVSDVRPGESVHRVFETKTLREKESGSSLHSVPVIIC